MKPPFYRLIALTMLIAGPLLAQPVAPDSPPPSPEELDQALGPIALYPDALIALILPSATDPSDVVLAARYLQDGGDPADTDDQPWDDSLKALAHYPDIVKWMDRNLTWTKSVGEAFVAEPAEVMNSIQRLRAQARAAGSLINTPQQQVMIDDGYINIIPAQPDVIYVPDYDPEVVYVSRPGYFSSSYLRFGLGYPTGFWLGYDLDWQHRRIWSVEPRDLERYWRDHRDWRRPSFPGGSGYAHEPDRHPWKPQPNAPRPPSNRPNTPRPDIQRPTPFPNGTAHPNEPRRNAPDRPAGNREPAPLPNRRADNPPVVVPQAGAQSVPPPRAAQPQPMPGRQPLPQPDRGTPGDRDNRGHDSRDNNSSTPRPPAAAPGRQPAPPRQPPPPPPVVKDDRGDDKNGRSDDDKRK